MSAPQPSRSQLVAELTSPGATFEVGVEDVLGVPTKVYVDRPRSLREVLDAATTEQQAEHVVYGTRRWSLGEFRDSVDQIASHLAEVDGVGAGDRVAILAANRPEWMMTFWATIEIGAIAVGINSWWKGDEILYALDDSGASVLVGDGPRLARVADDLGGRAHLRAVYSMDAESDLPARVLDFAKLLNGGAAVAPRPAIGEDDGAIILYTSGTTGRSKGAVSTHRSTIANLQNTQLNAVITRAWTKANPPAAPAMLLTSPMFHVSGCHSGIVVGMASRAKIVVPVGRADARNILRLIQDERITTWPTVPTLALRVAESPDRHDYDTSSLRAVAYGGSPSALEVQRRVQETFPTTGSAIRNAYGLTESSSVATVIEGDELVGRPTSVGIALPVVDVQITGEDGRAVPIGTSGEVWLHGSTIMSGYWNNPQATADALTPDRWLRTGDVGVLDDEGYLYIVDRFKDVIIRGGENVYSVEIENRLLEHPLVLDAAAIGVPHPTLGEEILAVVQLAPGADVGRDELRAWVSERLADFKVPEYVRAGEQPLPRNASGKLLKSVLRGDTGTAFAELL